MIVEVGQMPVNQVYFYSWSDIGLASGTTGFLGANATHTVTGAPQVLDISDDELLFEESTGYLTSGSLDTGAVQSLDQAITIDGSSFAAGTSIFSQASGAVTNSTTGQSGTLYVVSLDGGNAQYGFVSTIPLETGDSITIASWDYQNDTVSYASLYAPPPLDYIVGGTAGDDVIDGAYTGDPEGDLIDNNDHSDGSNADAVFAGAGNDSVVAGLGNDTVFGADGSDTILGGAGDDNLDGDDGAAGGAADYIDGGAGNDQIIGDYGNDTLIGGTGNDTVYAGDDNDLVYGDEGDDQLFGQAGDDSLYAGSGDDTVYGDIGNDYISGGQGNDSLLAGDGGDNVDGGDGDDIVYGGAGGDNIDGDAGNDALYGEAGSDSIWGGLGNDTIDGGSEADALYGGAGDDSILGGTGDDYIELSGGADVVFGGDDADNIWVNAVSYANGTVVAVDGGTGGADNDTLDLSSFDAFRNLSETQDADLDSTSGSVEVQNASGNWVTFNFTEIENLLLPANDLTSDYIVEGTTGDDVIDAGYTGDPQGDMVDNNDHSDGSNADSIEAGSGNDTVFGGQGNDTILGDTGPSSGGGGGAGVELLSNGSFEDGTHTANGVNGLTGWSNHSGSPDSADDGAAAESWNPANAASDGTGYITMWATTSAPNEAIQQTLATPLDAGTSYTLNFNAISADYVSGTWFTPTDIPVTFEIFDATTGAVLGSTTVQGTSYQGYSFDFTPSVEVTAIGVRPNGQGVGSNPSVILDEISLMETAAAPNDDELHGGDGDDFIYGETGDDTLYGDAGNDVLEGGAGNDILMGDGGDGTGAPATLDWTNVTLTNGDGTTTVTDGSDSVGVTVTGSGLINTGYGVDEYYRPTNVQITEANSTLIEFDGAVENVSFELFDVDSNGTSFDDQFTIIALDADGNEVPVTFTGVTHHTVTGNTIEGEDNLDTGNTGSQDAVTVTIPYEVVSIEIIYEPGSDVGNTGLAGIGDLNFEIVPSGDDYLDGGAGNDTINGMTGDDVVIGGTGDDSLDGSAGEDTLYGGDDQDSILGGLGNDVISGDAGDDTARGGRGNDTIDGGLGNDSLYGNEGDDSITGGAGNDSIYGETGDDYVSGGDGDDSLEGNEGDDTLIGGAGNDWIRGSFGNDSIEGNEGDDYLWGGYGDDTFAFADNFGNDTVEGEEAFETDGDTIDLSAVTSDLTIDLTSANPETGTFTDGTGTVSFVEIENIVLGSGVDTLVLGTGGGADRVEGFSIPTESGGVYTGVDQLDVSTLLDTNGAPVNTDDVVVSADVNGDAILTFPSGESLTLVGVTAESINSPDILEAMGIPQPNYVVEGTSGADLIDGTYITDPDGDVIDGLDNAAGTNADSVQAGAGDDTVLSYVGNDTIDAGTGNDSVDAGDGDDVVFGGAGDDTIQGWFGNDSLVGGDGADSLIGFLGDDTLAGGAGDDSIEGGDGEDLIILENGFGNDTIDGGDGGVTDYDTLDLSSVTTDTTIDLTGANPENGTVTSGADTATFTDIENIVLGAGTDTIVLADGSGADRVEGFQPPTDLGGGVYSGNDRLDVSGMTDASGALVNVDDVTVTDTNGDGTGDAILSFPNGESITLIGVSPSEVSGTAQLEALGIPAPDYIVSGTAGDDLIDGSYLGDPEGDLVDAADNAAGTNDDLIVAGAGNDTVDGGAGSDTIYGDLGNDSILGGAGSDALFGGEGDDSLFGQGGGDIIFGGDGNDSINTGQGADVAYGEAGNDYMVDGSNGGLASTLYGGDGDDTLVSGTGNANALYDGGAGDDLMQDIGGPSGNQTWIAGAGNDTVEAAGGNDSIDGGDGNDSLLGGAGADTVFGGAGDDTIDGGADDDLLFGFDGDDSIFGSDGSDILNGMAGNDTLSGGADDDIIWHETGTGNDTVIGGETGLDQDTLQASGLTVDAVLDFTANGTGADAESGTLSSSGGADVSTFIEIENVQLGSGNDLVIGSSGDENVSTGAGADTVDGGAGNDRFDIGISDGDVDTVIMEDGDGDDTITGFEVPTNLGGGVFTPNDQIDVSGLTDAGGNPVNVLDVTVSDTNGDGSGDAILSFPNGESITLVGVSPADVDSYNALVALGIPGTDGIVSGTGGDDVIDVTYTGDPDGDMVDAGDNAAGNDDDVIEAGAGNDTIIAGAGNDTLIGGAGDDVLLGGAGADSLLGGTGADSITVGENDYADGGDGDDVFTIVQDDEPGTGAITIIGGEGDETLGDTLDFAGLIGFGDVTYTNADPGVGGGLTGFATLGDGTVVNFTEIENVIICFTEGTRIATPLGARDIEDLEVGDLVVTRDHGLQPIRWVGKRTVPARGSLAPIRFDANVIGNERPLYVSPQHRMLVQGYEASLLFGESEVLASAKHLVNGSSVTEAHGGEVTYVHIMFDQHEIIYAEGAASESFFPGGTGLDAVKAEAREELFGIFPELRSHEGVYGDTARLCLKAHESRLLRLG